MKTLAQVWTTFLFANIVSIGHVSGLNVPRCHLLYCIMREDLTIDVANDFAADTNGADIEEEIDFGGD